MNWFNVTELFIASILGFVSTLFIGFVSNKIAANRHFKYLLIEAKAMINSLEEIGLNSNRNFINFSPTIDIISHNGKIYSGLSRNKYFSAIKLIALVNEFTYKESRFDIVNNVEEKQEIISSRKRIVEELKEVISIYER